MLATVTYPKKEGSMLLATKADKIGRGKLNGFGGKPEKGDMSIKHTASRELYEETGYGIAVHPLDLETCARVQFYFFDSETPQFEVVFIIATKFAGEAKSTKEMIDPTWYPLSEIESLYEKMLPADGEILSRILKGEKFIGHVRFNEDMSACTEMQFETVYDTSQILTE